jgi:HemX protein
MKTWMYDIIIYIYALSLLFYFSDFVSKNMRTKRMGTGLLTFVWLLQTIFFIVRWFGDMQKPFYTMFDVLFFFAWTLVTLSLILNLLFRMDLLVFFVNVLGFSVLALNFFSNPNVSPSLSHWKIEDELLFIHISFAVLSYVAFAVSGILSGMYLFLHRMLKKKKWSITMQRLPSLDKIEQYTSYAVVLGTPLLILSLSLGIVWIILIGDYSLLLDIKVLNSFLIIAAYGFYLVQRYSFKAPGKTCAIWNLGALVVVAINFIISNYVSGFHQWIWM